ncbi:uncharacterized protein F4807DRAFT_444317 [Annulohypoxylon truncatum]|uniref:uncharacterized protein n=1 Tax=Annulohypoxylon truncatum TaxID=327061 RepID=UPI0020084D55|nr:uncharacterized protein F4807DRAFT_444317 [Annulohypoxylon truncatum]KAI1205040.1 hypothetical protein F4807DRAFT_444317 [Annulohypoxylon truncatum]
MENQQATEKKPSGGEASMKEIWDEAAKAFKEICGESLQRGDITGFHDVQMKIEGISKVSYGVDDAEQRDKWDKAKSVGLDSLQYLKLLVGVASQASSVIPIPASAANIASSALCFVFDIPQAIKGYNDAINQVFGEVSSALSQFHIYTSIQNINPELIQRIHLVMVSFVKLCAHVVNYRQGRKRDRLLRQIKSIFDDDSGLGDEMTKFKQALQQQRDVEGTVTLAVVVKTQQDVAMVLEQSVIFGKTVDETHQLVQETQKDVQSFKDDANRSKTLIKIRDALGVWATVRLDTNTTQTCTDIYERCHNRTGSWIWMHDAYTAWTVPNKDKKTSHILILSGPPSSGKTSASALITKRLEEQKGRTYVAHYFFPPSTKKSDDEKTSPVHSALKYMAFQIARVDVTVQKPLGKVCDIGPGVFRRSTSLETLDALWGELKIGTPGLGTTYYLVFDGLENLPDKQTEILLKFVFGSKLAQESAGRVRILVSGTDDYFVSRAGGANTSSALRIRMEEHNRPDMRIIVDEELTKRGLLEHAKSGSEQQRARDKIIEKLPQSVNGSYSHLKFALEDVVRLLSTRTAARELDRLLDQPISSHEAAIKNLQRSLTAEEIGELNELLKWVLFCNEPMTLDQLEAAMYLYSGTESLASLQFIVKNKYSAVLKLEKGYVYGQDGVKDYLQKDKDISDKSSHSKGRSTISMTITINNVDQELCGHFLWDLAHKAIRDKFKFDFDAGSPNSALHSSNQAAIRVDEFEAHHTIVTRAFEYLDRECKDQTRAIGNYLVGWLPHHLGRLRELEDEEKGALTPGEQMEIGQNLYKLFKDRKVFLRHKTSFEETIWYVEEMEGLQKWLMDSAVVRRLDKKWRDEVRLPISPTRSFMKEFVKVVVEALLRERCWDVEYAYFWIREFMGLDKKLQQTPERLEVDEEKSSGPTGFSSVHDSDEIDWEGLSAWCQNFLGLPDAELNSLWYERLAETLSTQSCKACTVLSLYERAIEMGNPSWLCHRGLGKTHFTERRIQKAVAHGELALKEAEQEGATPKPKAKDIVELHLLLGLYLYEANNMQKAAEHYLFACESEVPVQAREGQLGYLKAGLNVPDAEAKRQLLKSILVKGVGKGTMASVLKMIARNAEHDIVVSKMFTVAKDDTDLFRGIIRAMKTATEMPAPSEDDTGEITEDSIFADNEARGVLLYDQGVAAYTYMSSDDTKAVGEALQLWKKSRDLLSNVGGRNALIARQDATAALAKHYFQEMIDGNHLDHTDELIRLTVAEIDVLVYYDDAAGFLGTVYALQGKMEQARDVLVGRMRQAFRILLDDIPENDAYGFAIIIKTLEHCQDFANAAFALSLGIPDIITDALFFDTKDIVRDDVDKERLSDMVNKLAGETVQIAKAQIPDASQQMRRIEAAKAHVDSLIASTQAKSNAETNRDCSEAEGSEIQDNQGKLTTSDPERTSALNLLRSRLSALQQGYSPETDSQWGWSCDGRTIDGKHCENKTSFEREMYHCIYCTSRDFCGDCLARLRARNSGAGITACSAEHRWLRIPHWGDAMYVGPKAESVRMPKGVRPTKDDERILEVFYGEDGGEEIAVEAWKEALAQEWGISLEEIRKEISRQATPNGDEQGEKKNEG